MYNNPYWSGPLYGGRFVSFNTMSGPHVFVQAVGAPDVHIVLVDGRWLTLDFERQTISINTTNKIKRNLPSWF